MHCNTSIQAIDESEMMPDVNLCTDTDSCCHISKRFRIYNALLRQVVGNATRASGLNSIPFSVAFGNIMSSLFML